MSEYSVVKRGVCPGIVGCSIVGWSVMALAGGPTDFPDTFEECRADGGDVEREGDVLSCSLSISYENGEEKPPNWKDCVKKHPKIVGDDFGGRASYICSGRFEKNVPEKAERKDLGETLPSADAARVERLVEVLRSEDDDWDRRDIYQLMLDNQEVRRGVADVLGSAADAELRREAAELIDLYYSSQKQSYDGEVLEVVEKVALGPADRPSMVRARSLRVLWFLAGDDEELPIEASTDQLWGVTQEILREGSPDARRYVLRKWRDFQLKEHPGAVVDQLRASDLGVREEAWGTLDEVGGDEQLERVVEEFSEFSAEGLAPYFVHSALEDLTYETSLEGGETGVYCRLFNTELTAEQRRVLTGKEYYARPFDGGRRRDIEFFREICREREDGTSSDEATSGSDSSQ